MGNPKEEHDVFEGFISADPDFAGSRVSGWSQPPSDPPDVACYLEGGTKVGVELTSWLDESQIGRARKQEMIEDSFREAIDPEPPNQTEHISLVWMAPKRRMIPSDGAAFRAELIAVTDEIDRRWDNEPSWHSPQGFFYGTTYDGGTANAGVVYKMDATGHQTVLHSFTGSSDGAHPANAEGLAFDAAGNVYGTAADGGIASGSAGSGVAFKLDTSGHQTVIYTFTGSSFVQSAYSGTCE